MASYLAAPCDSEVMKQQWARMCSKQAALDGHEPNPERAAKRHKTEASTRPNDLKLPATSARSRRKPRTSRTTCGA